MSPYSRIKLNFDYTRIKPPEKLSLIRVRGMGISGALLDSPYFLIKARGNHCDSDEIKNQMCKMSSG